MLMISLRAEKLEHCIFGAQTYTSAMQQLIILSLAQKQNPQCLTTAEKNG